MKTLIKHLLTARDNATFSLTKLLGLSAACEMLYKFAQDTGADYTGFAMGISAIIAALAAKYHVEGTNEKGDTGRCD